MYVALWNHRVFSRFQYHNDFRLAPYFGDAVLCETYV